MSEFEVSAPRWSHPRTRPPCALAMSRDVYCPNRTAAVAHIEDQAQLAELARTLRCDNVLERDALSAALARLDEPKAQAEIEAAESV